MSPLPVSDEPVGANELKGNKNKIMILAFILFLLCVVLVLLGIMGLSWFISGKLLHRTRKAPALSIQVADITPQTITLQRTKQTRLPGVFGITGTEGQAIVGSLLAEDAETVQRELLAVKGTLPKHTNISWNTTVYGQLFRDSLSLNIQEIAIEGVLGKMPAWYVPGSQENWAVLVHGATGTREQTLRASRTLVASGFSLLTITYRGDEGTPASGLSHLGETEWQDLEAGVRYALEHGAQQVILYGWSLGGTIVEVFLNQSALADQIQAVILDSPILSWRMTLTSLIKKNRLPVFLARTTEQVVTWRTGVRLSHLDQMCQAKKQPLLPYLLFHGAADSTAPCSISETFAAQHSQATYHRIAEAEHTQAWNANPAFYEQELGTFLARIFKRCPAQSASIERSDGSHTHH